MPLDASLPSLLHPFARPAAARDVFVDIVAGNGAEVTDAQGRTYVDALGSLWYCNVGHGRAEIADAVAAQMRRLEVFHTFDRFTNPMADALAERLAALAPMDDARVFLTSGGSESVETAIKLARHRPAPGRASRANRHREPASLLPRGDVRSHVGHRPAPEPGGVRAARARRRPGPL